MMTRLDLIEQFENETELSATWSNGGIGGCTKEYTEWLEQELVKNLTIPRVTTRFSFVNFMLGFMVGGVFCLTILYLLL